MFVIFLHFRNAYDRFSSRRIHGKLVDILFHLHINLGHLSVIIALSFNRFIRFDNLAPRIPDLRRSSSLIFTSDINFCDSLNGTTGQRRSIHPETLLLCTQIKFVMEMIVGR